MDTRTWACAAAGAIGVLAGTASGQAIGAFFEVSNDLSPSQPTATVTLWVPVPDDLYAVAAVAFDAFLDPAPDAAPSAAWSDPMRAVGFDAPGTSDGVVSADGLAVLGALPGQLNFPAAGIFADPSNPIAVWSATISVDDFTPRGVDVRTDIRRSTFYVGDSSAMSVDRAIGDARATVMVVPAPGVGGVLALGLLGVGARSRRR
ncbi:MAG: hypothetical protein RIB58_06995 [Phycisphaerales bacterium]